MIRARNALIGAAYRNIVKPIYFRMDPEFVHDKVLGLGSTLGKSCVTRGLTKALFSYNNPMLSQTLAGIRFENPVGLAAGFDKNARLTDIAPSIGLGFTEIGTITGEACAGNPKPRLWRLPKSEALVINYGLMNDGCVAIEKRLKGKKFRLPVGVSIGKTNCKDTVDMNKGIADYKKAYKVLSNIGSYDDINISCPNAWGGQPFTWPSHLKKLLSELDDVRNKKPMFLKISPDLSNKELGGIIKVAKAHDVKGLIFSNLTHKRMNIKDDVVPDKGSISGKPIKHMSTEQLRYTYQKSGDEFILVGCGGIFNAQDAYEKIIAGASLLQMITGMIYRGPQVVSEINLGLVKLLKKDGYKNIRDAVGSEHR